MTSVSAAVPDGASTGNPAGFIVGSVNEGLSSTAALGAYREAGGSIRTQTWYRLYGEVTDSMARSGAAGALDPNQLPGAADYATWTMGRGGQYATDVDVMFRLTGTGLIGRQRFTHVTDAPHTPGDAISAAMDAYGDDDVLAPGGSGEGQVIMGASVANVYQTIAFGE